MYFSMRPESHLHFSNVDPVTVPLDVFGHWLLSKCAQPPQSRAQSLQKSSCLWEGVLLLADPH